MSSEVKNKYTYEKYNSYKTRVTKWTNTIHDAKCIQKNGQELFIKIIKYPKSYYKIYSNGHL